MRRQTLILGLLLVFTTPAGAGAMAVLVGGRRQGCPGPGMDPLSALRFLPRRALVGWRVVSPNPGDLGARVDGSGGKNLGAR